jgi:hypothetical protein
LYRNDERPRRLRRAGRRPAKIAAQRAGMNEPKLSPRRLKARGDHTRDPAEGLPMLSVFPTEMLWMAAGVIMIMAGFLASSASE